ncbi:hypothetical protein LEP1GSC036_2935 [Leptospira weilii str. 2006001853]|uniref:Uncharacterized protein n=3 Tax=Leptospira weilii TaxID=28184 RepID=A0A828Z3D8_9LEPT|nr:hypothetical protein LEP1GSC036_2935 [Leptospira weilii str. 2006001853]EMJ67478.1 hypothetical protein LEP1GSC051_1739 [Leptospira sp. P2653]EMM71280.1 hypothetical protein LEP1GSC038_3105 [Leptospira weilii str. 2006001855]EMN43022.1 hypothetical protein LEP1GSC086_0098 [Leptospira weilii str. LNT 1234]EMN88475.1 hypothetical protein LEP1GSC108_2029 [Leptospira weilii str. UI 13098]OMI19317.1 hypothetical protein BUQ74_00660 [Leptospira weilii serovar Heyan]QDK22736.1 hypothetical protei
MNHRSSYHLFYWTEIWLQKLKYRTYHELVKNDITFRPYILQNKTFMSLVKEELLTSFKSFFMEKSSRNKTYNDS